MTVLMNTVLLMNPSAPHTEITAALESLCDPVFLTRTSRPASTGHSTVAQSKLSSRGFFPRRSQVFGTVEREQPQPSSSSYCQTQSVATHTPPQEDQGARRNSNSGSSKQKDLRTVILSKRISAKWS